VTWKKVKLKGCPVAMATKKWGGISRCSRKSLSDDAALDRYHLRTVSRYVFGLYRGPKKRVCKVFFSKN
jgi:hypothetical protein